MHAARWVLPASFVLFGRRENQVTGAAYTVLKRTDGPTIPCLAEAFIETDEIFVDQRHDLALAMLFDGDLRINQPPGLANPGFELCFVTGLDS